MAIVNQPFNMSLPKAYAGLSSTIYYFIELIDDTIPIGPTTPGDGIQERVIEGFDPTASYRTNAAEFDDSWTGRIVWVETTNQLVYEQPFSPATLRAGSIAASTFADNAVVPADLKSIMGNASAATSFLAQVSVVFQGEVSGDAAPTTGTFTANLATSPGLSTVQAFYSTPPSVIAFLSANNQCKAAKVQSYSFENGVGRFTLATPLPQASSVGDKFIILGIAL